MKCLIILLLLGTSLQAQVFTSDTCYIVGDIAERRIREFDISEDEIIRTHPSDDVYVFTRLKGNRWRDEYTGLKLTIIKEEDLLTFEYYRGRGITCTYKLN